jgi:hypothetical protein
MSAVAEVRDRWNFSHANLCPSSPQISWAKKCRDSQVEMLIDLISLGLARPLSFTPTYTTPYSKMIILLISRYRITTLTIQHSKSWRSITLYLFPSCKKSPIDLDCTRLGKVHSKIPLLLSPLSRSITVSTSPSLSIKSQRVSKSFCNHKRTQSLSLASEHTKKARNCASLGSFLSLRRPQWLLHDVNRDVGAC